MFPTIKSTRTLSKQNDLIILSGKKNAPLKEAGLDKKQTAYITGKLKDKEVDFVSVNTYERHVYVIRQFNANEPAEKEKFRIIGSRINAHLKANGSKKVTLDIRENEQAGQLVTEGLALAAYDFDKYRTDKKKAARKLDQILLFGVTDKKALDVLVNTIEGTCITRTLVNEPVLFLTAVQLSKEIEKLSKTAGFKFEYFNKKKIESLKMGGVLGVNRGSKEPPTFNIMEWKPANAQNKKPLVLVGKGVVFDTGGSSLKSSVGMEKMKGDMAGGAAVIGAMYSIAKSKLPYHVIGLVPATDNRLDNKAIVPSDVLTMYSGKTVEVMNTDAEGRLILADALHYASKYKPELVIDLATLTGAAVVTVADIGIVGMQKDAENEYSELEAAGKDVYERLVQLPLWEEYEDFLKSNVADIKNIGGPYAGSITAGKFLEVFTSFPWIHLDLSSALLDKTNHYRTVGGSGAGTRLLVEFVKNKLK